VEWLVLGYSQSGAVITLAHYDLFLFLGLWEVGAPVLTATSGSPLRR